MLVLFVVLCVLCVDIILFDCDVVVNVVNSLLFGGGGVDGVIYCVVGLELLEVCCVFYGCCIGEVKFMFGFWLFVCYVIYIVGLI